MYELQSPRELRELYDEWFSNKDYWFSKNSKIDVYLCDKYYKYIEITENIYENYKNNLCHYEDKTIIACIILLDQITRHYKRVYDNNIDVIEYSQKAINFSKDFKSLTFFIITTYLPVTFNRTNSATKCVNTK